MASKMTVAQLKKELEELGLDTKGLKSELIARLDNAKKEKKEDMEEDNPKKSSKRKVEETEEPKKVPAKRGKAVSKKEEKEEKEEEEEKEENGEEEGEEEEGDEVDTSVEAVPIRDMKGKYGLQWYRVGKSFSFQNSSEIKGSDKIVGFDMDGTILCPKSGAKFPKGRKDWVWLYENSVKDKLCELNKNGFKVVIFTNQAGIEKKKQKPSDIHGKILDLSEQLGFPIQAFVAEATDHWRKPNTTMWEYMVSKLNGGIIPDLSKCTFVGDAAGRPKGWKSGIKKDFSCGDRAFAYNINVTFKTPEEFFLGESTAKFEWDSIDPAEILKKLTEPKKFTTEEVVKKEQEMVLFVGCPASGKSTFARKHFVPSGYVHVNQDTLRTKEKCAKVAREAVESGKSVVIDNTNPGADHRSLYTSIAKEAGIPFRCFIFNTNVELAHHLNFYREKITQGGVRRVPDVGYNQFKSKFREPTKKEGFSEITKVEWAPEFESEEHKKLFLQRT